MLQSFILLVFCTRGEADDEVMPPRPLPSIQEIPPWQDDPINAESRGRATFVSSAEFFNDDEELPPITVVTRSGFRPQCLANLQASLSAQRSVKEGFLQIISNDAERPGWTLVSAYQQFGNSTNHRISLVNLKRENYYTGNGRCQSTKYLQLLYSMVPSNSWIVTLDDDARLTDPEQLRRIQLAASRSNPNTDVLLQDTFMGKNVIVQYPNYTLDYEDARIPKIDTAAVIFHKSATQNLHLSGNCGGDKVIFRQLVKTGPYRPVHIRQDSPGVWANYDGAARQDLSTCNIVQLAPGERAFLDSLDYRRGYLGPDSHLQDDAELHYDIVRLRRKVKMRKANDTEIAELREMEREFGNNMLAPGQQGWHRRRRKRRPESEE